MQTLQRIVKSFLQRGWFARLPFAAGNFSKLQQVAEHGIHARSRVFNPPQELYAFFIQPPTVNGISDVNGGGTLAGGATAKANWIIIPTTPAAVR